jgi:predicted ATPase
VTRSIAYLEENPGLDERSRMKLYAALGWPQMLSTGNNGMKAWSVALEIAEHLGDVDHQMRAVWATWVDRLNRAEPEAALVFSDRFRELASASTDRMDAVLGIRLDGATKHWLGRQGVARAAMERVLEAYVDPPASHAVRFQFDQRVTARIILARTFWLQGFADQALTEVRDTVDYANGIGHNLSLSNVLAEAACSVALWSGDDELAERYIDLLAEHTKADSLDVWHTYATCFSGMLSLARHRPARGLEMLDTGIESLRLSGFVLFQTEFLGAKAQALLRLGEGASALRSVNDALQRCESTGERWCLAELHRVKGEILAGGDPLDDSGSAMAEFDRSMKIAAHDGTLAWQLRSAVSIARLLRDQDRADSAKLILSSTYDRFTEGFQTRDLREADVLLRSLCENQE